MVTVMNKSIKRTNNMTEGSPWKHIVRFALPVLLGSLLQQLYNTVDTIIVGNFASEEALSAVGTTGSFAFLFLAIATGFSAGNGVVIAQYYGAKDEKSVRANASTGMILLLGLGLVASIPGVKSPGDTNNCCELCARYQSGNSVFA